MPRTDARSQHAHAQQHCAAPHTALLLSQAADPSVLGRWVQVRPLPVLREAFAMVGQRWKKERDYEYACEQLKCIRQDLTVQHLTEECSRFAVLVRHARRPETRPRPETQDPRPETQEPRPETRGPRPEPHHLPTLARARPCPCPPLPLPTLASDQLGPRPRVFPWCDAAAVQDKASRPPSVLHPPPLLTPSLNHPHPPSSSALLRPPSAHPPSSSAATPAPGVRGARAPGAASR